MAEIVRQRGPGERKIISNGEPTILHEGRIGAIVGLPMLVDQGEGYVAKMFERFVRPPGTRIIALQDDKIYLQKEYRLETKDSFDWRLPGGMVIDTFAEYKKYLTKEIPEAIVLEAGKRELNEEAKLDAETFRVFKKSTCGAKVEWDLYYLIAEGVHSHAHDHSVEGEEMADMGWFSKEEILEMCRSGAINEDRSVGILTQFLATMPPSAL